MKFKLSFYEREVYIDCNETDGMKLGEILALTWPKFDEMDKLLHHFKTEFLWRADADPGDEDCHYQLTDESEVMLVFSITAPQSLRVFREKLNKGWD